MTRLEKLISIGSKPLCRLPPAESNSPGLPSELFALLRSRNGFSAFESALVIFPSTNAMGVPGIHEWNDSHAWRRHYRDVFGIEHYCFAQDLFGLQFAIANSKILRLNPESGGVSVYADSIEEWARRLLENYEEDTGWPLAHEWQLMNGLLPPHMRLLPKLPFVLGGEYQVENLLPVECQKAMEYWGKLYAAIRNLPDGKNVTVEGWIQ